MSAPITKSLTCAPAVTGLKTRALHGVDCVVSDDYADPKRAVVERLPEVVWQRSYVHFLRNAPDSRPARPTTSLFCHPGFVRHGAAVTFRETEKHYRCITGYKAQE